MIGRRVAIVFGSLLAILVLSTTCVIGAAYHAQVGYDLNHPEPDGLGTRVMKGVLYPVGQVVFPLLMSERTRYAAGYREDAFRSLKVGMTEHDVQISLGQPLLKKTFSDGETVWYYSKQATERDNYYVRNVVFDQTGHLVGRHAEFYVD